MGSVYQGAWQAQSYQGAWQQQSQAYSATLTDTITITGQDSLVGALGRAYLLTDGISLADALAASAKIALAESIGLTDNLTQGTSRVITDSVSLVDALSGALAASRTLGDTISLIDAMAVTASKSLADVLNLTEKLSQGFLLADLVTLSETLAVVGRTIADDAIAMNDSITGVLAPGIITPGVGDTTLAPITTRRQPVQWDKTVDNTPSPVSAFVRSSTGTTYTSRGVSDSGAWNLGDAVKGDLAITSEAFMGRVLTVDVPGKSITVDAWHKPTSLAGLAAELPTDGTQLTLHKIVACRRVLMMSDVDNDNTIYIGTYDSVTPDDGHPFSNDPRNRNFHLTLESGIGGVNLSRIWAVCGSEQTLHVTTEGILPLVAGGLDYIQLGDTLTLTDDLAMKAHIHKGDAVSLVDDLTGVLTPGGSPVLQVAPTSLDFWYDESSLNTTITNIGSGTLTWSLSGVPAYLTPSSSSGSLGASASEVVSFTANRSGLSEGDRLADSFTVNSNGGTQVVTTEIIKVYSLTCSEIEALSEIPMTITLAPADAATRGNATFDPASGTMTKFVPERGGWNITISGTNDTIVAVVAVQNKKWLSFVSGTPFNLTEQTSYDVYIEGQLRNVMNQGEDYYAQYAYRSGAWEYMTGATGICGAIGTASVSLLPADSISGMASAMTDWNYMGSGGTSAPMQARPYCDEHSNAVYLSDLYYVSQDYKLSGVNIIPRVPAVPQTAPPRAATSAGANPLCYTPTIGDPSTDAIIAEVNAGVDLVWGAMPGVAITDGRVTHTIIGGANWHYRNDYQAFDHVAMAFSIVLNMTLRGGSNYIDLTGGEEGQIVELRLSNNAYWKWFRVGMNEKYHPLEPHGYRPMDSFDGYLESIPVIPLATSYPGSNYSFVAQFSREATFWWGTNVTGPAGTSGIQPIVPIGYARVILKKVGANWVVQYAENAWFINTAKDDIVIITYP
jgi:hypothetical protein